MDIPEHKARAVAVVAGCDPRTVRKRVRGEKVQPALAERIDAALKAAGLGKFTPKEAK